MYCLPGVTVWARVVGSYVVVRWAPQWEMINGLLNVGTAGILSEVFFQTRST